MKNLIAVFMLFGVSAFVPFVEAGYSPFATEVVDYSSDLVSSGLYDNPQNVLGKPTLNVPGFMGWSGSSVKVTEAAFGADRLTTIENGGFVTVKFDHRIDDDALNPFGLDFIVFGNSFYVGGATGDSRNMQASYVNGGVFSESISVSVSQNGQDWYTYLSPQADDIYPTQAYEWDQEKFNLTGNGWGDEMDFTRPVDPELQDRLFAGGSASVADIIVGYEGSGGGTGFDLAESGFDWIEYVHLSGRGEVDSLADVAAIPEPATMVLLGVGGLAFVRRKR